MYILIRYIYIRYDQNVILGIELFNFTEQGFQRCLAVNFKADYHVKTQRFLLGVGVETVHLKRPVVRHDCFLHRVAHLRGLVVGGVERINADACQNNSRFKEDISLYFARDPVYVVNVQIVR